MKKICITYHMAYGLEAAESYIELPVQFTKTDIKRLIKNNPHDEFFTVDYAERCINSALWWIAKAQGYNLKDYIVEGAIDDYK